MVKLSFMLSGYIARRRLDAGEFCYVYKPSNKTVSGKKAVLAILKSDGDNFSKLAKECDKTVEDASFDADLLKVIPHLPFETKEEAEASKKQAEEESKKEEEIIIVEESVANKNYPLTLDYMKAIDARTTKIPNYGSLVGRIARLLGLLLWKEDGKIFSMKSNMKELEIKDIHAHIEEEHKVFLDNLEHMFPPAKKRIGQFIEKAAENFDMRVPTWRMVERLQQEESERVEEEKKRERAEREKKLKEAREELARKRKEEEEQRKVAREELAKKKKEDEEKRLALKRKQAEEQRLNELKQMKLSPNIERVDEIMKIKKEIQRIDRALTGKFVKESSQVRLKDKRTEEMEKLKKILREVKQKRVDERMESCLENLSPKQLRKLSMEYFNNISRLDTVS